MKHKMSLIGLAQSLLGTLLITLLATVAAFGQGEQTGILEGTVSDVSGARVPGATVKVEGAAFNRTVTTNSDGFYRLLQVPPGTYKVIVTADRFSTATAEAVEVLLGKTTPVDVALKVGSVSEQVVITSDDVTRIDPTDNKIQTNITARQIDALPKGTNFGSILKISPAVRQEPLSGQFQIDGASGSENSFIIDGQEVSNFRTGVVNLNNNLPFAFVQEIQIKTSGFEAEFGGATGGVINVVTKGGSNEFHGDARLELEPSSLFAGPRASLLAFRSGTGATFRQVNEYIRPARDKFTNYYPSFTLGGPIAKDRLWFLVSYSPQILDTKRVANYFTNAPAATRVLTLQETYRNRRRNEYTFARLDAAPTNNLRLTGTFTWNPLIDLGAIPVGNLNFNGNTTNPISVLPSANFGGSIGTLRGQALTDRQGGRQNANNTTFQAVWTPTSSLVTSFRFSRGFLNEKLGSYFVPRETRFICSGAVPPPASAGCALGFQNIASNNVVNFDASVRENYEADASYIVNRFLGRHQFKGGYQHQKVENNVERGYVPYGIVQVYYDRNINSLTGRGDTVTPGAIGAGSLTRIGTVGKASNIAQSIYLQDRWQPFSRLSINAGFRMEKEDLPSFNGLAPPINFGWGDKIVPRIGAAFDPTGSGKGKFFFSFGRFTDRLKFELPRGSFGGDFYRVDYFEIFPNNPRYDYFTLARILGNNQDVLGGKCPINNASGLTRCQYDFRIASNNPDAAPEDGQVDPNLKPFRQQELTFGFERELSSNYLLSVRYTHKNVLSAIEDAGFPTPEGSEAYIIGNPGEGLHAETARRLGYPKTIKPERRYDALEFRFDRRFVNNYFFQANYTYSRLYGNYSGLASSDENGRTSPGVNRFFDLPHLGFTAAGTPDNGRLATDRPHVFNIYGGYNFTWFEKFKGNETLVSLISTVQSGTPITSTYTLYATAVFKGRGDLGRTPVFTNTDFTLQHRYRIGEKYALGFTFNALNVFNESNVINLVFNPFAINPGLAEIGQSGRTEPQVLNTILTSGLTSQLDAYLNDPANPQRRQTAYGMPNSFQGGRAIRLGLSFTF